MTLHKPKFVLGPWLLLKVPTFNSSWQGQGHLGNPGSLSAKVYRL